MTLLRDVLKYGKQTIHRTISLCDERTGEKYTDLLELQILELKKLPADLREDDEVIRWMRFLAGKSRKEFREMARTSEYIEEAYRELERMSADERARLEYEARQKAIRDHDAIMTSAWENGLENGVKQGMERGMQQERREIVLRMLGKGMDPEMVADLTGMDIEGVRELEEDFRTKEGTETLTKN